MTPTLKAAPLLAVLTMLAAVVSSPAMSAAQEPELLDPEKAFRISTRALDERSVEVHFEIADGYYMYRDRFRFETAAGRLLADVEPPKGKVKNDPFFGKSETYDLMLNRTEPTAPTDCENPVDELIALGQRLGARSTPTWFLPDGTRYMGALPMSQVVPLLDATAPRR